ncbi:hypothetical protein [Chitinophaga ginsengisegetis]|uniref:hypothetical protein n=1 Tax=Chitinophaga ginsengisegetis TaxID=393003 RepID=UPI000DB98C8E|nr:hypothetical protein [Chitinophaga ginsengisegetis]MDR6567448.1 hypothetical protein [Chitinophaga ginsengisegetis]MDR6647179.1 hypothetical protein [Chitinophaga ginsengisegetis]MDR6653528.1 hypothetical protein [Chitinophaga ginsengisegetis]
MKRAKFALTAIAVLAVVGGALAFKANRVVNTFYGKTTTLQPDDAQCTQLITAKLNTTIFSLTSIGTTTQLSTAPNPNVTACVTRVITVL